MKTKDLISAFFNISNDLDLPENEYTPPKGLQPLKTQKTVNPIKRNTNKKNNGSK